MGWAIAQNLAKDGNCQATKEQLTTWVYEQKDEHRIQCPLINGGKVQRHHGDEQGQRPNLTSHGGKRKLVPEFAQIGEGHHRYHCYHRLEQVCSFCSIWCTYRVLH